MCVLAHPAHVRSVPDRESNVSDVQWLVDLLAHGLIEPSFVPEHAIQQVWDLNGPVLQDLVKPGDDQKVASPSRD